MDISFIIFVIVDLCSVYAFFVIFIEFQEKVMANTCVQLSVFK